MTELRTMIDLSEVRTMNDALDALEAAEAEGRKRGNR